MSLPVILRRAARVEFDAAADCYEARSVGRGAAFTAAVGEVLSAIATRPFAHPEVHPGVREALVARDPYAVYFQVEPLKIIVLAVLHTSRDPSEWQGRA